MKKFIKCIVFILGLVLIYTMLYDLFCVDDSRVYEGMQGYYAEEANTLDAVYIGSSNVYAYWQAPLAWNEYGHAVYPLTVPAMLAQATQYIVEEGIKTQPDALYIINLNLFTNTKVNETKIHYLADRMNFSATKVRMIEKLTDDGDIDGFDKLEYYFPIIRFHSRWNELTEEDFNLSLKGIKGASVYDNFLKTSTDVTDEYRYTEEKTEITEKQQETLESLLQFCKAEAIKVLFVTVPQAIEDEETVAQLNTIEEIVRAEGFDVLDLMGSVDEIGLDFETDYYNAQHTNIHGSIKFTYYLGQYLSQNYGFEDKREHADFSEWNDAYDKYVEWISPYVTETELRYGEVADN